MVWGTVYYPNNEKVGNLNVISSSKEILKINLKEAKKNELFWQGIGSGYLTEDVNRKEQRINEFATQILAQYPPVIDKHKEKTESKK